MRRRVLAWALLLAMMVPLLSGCWDNREPRRRAYVLGLAIDAAESPEGYLEVSVQLPVPGKAAGGGGGKAQGGDGGGGGAEFYLVKGNGGSLSEALEKAQDEVSRDLFLGQMRAVIFSSHLSAEQLRHAVEGMRGIGDVEDTVYTVMARGRADDILGRQTTLERLPALYFNNIFEAVRRQTVFAPVQLWQFWRAVKTSGWEPIMPAAHVTDKIVELRGFAVFNGYELRGFLSGEEAQGYLWLMGRTRNRSLSVPTVRGLSGGKAMTATRSVMTRLEHGKPVFRVHLRVTGEVSLTPPGGGSEAEVEEVNEAIRKAIRQQIDRAIARAQEEFRSDIFGFGRTIFYRFPDYFAARDWDELFPEVRIEPVVTVDLVRKGARR